jgi:iron complex transport system substrate-binding protein
VLALEWLAPPFVGGHWVPEMIEIAGGADSFGKAGERSRTVTWEELARAQADVVLVMPCGYGTDGSVQEAGRYRSRIESVGAGRAVAFDASAYFSRPGPRLVTGVELLAHVLHPDRTERPVQYDTAVSELELSASARA